MSAPPRASSRGVSPAGARKRASFGSCSPSLPRSAVQLTESEITRGVPQRSALISQRVTSAAPNSAIGEHLTRRQARYQLGQLRQADLANRVPRGTAQRHRYTPTYSAWTAVQTQLLPSS